MQVTELKVDKQTAKQFLRVYREHRDKQTPMDREIQKAYYAISRGRVVIQALQSIRDAGLNAEGFPKLALCRADAKVCYYRGSNAGGTFSIDKWARHNETRRTVDVRWNENRPLAASKDGEAIVPLIPVHLRPKAELSNYYILWEAEWKRVPPTDPMLLVRMAGDMWLVVAAWDLTPVERAAMSSRL